MATAAAINRIASRPAYLPPLPAPSRTDTAGARLDRIGTMQSAAAGKTVVQEQDPADYVYKVAGGTLRAVRMLPDGRRYITNFLLPGDFFGFTESGRYPQTVEAVADAKLIRYSRRGFDSILESDAHAGRHFFGLMCEELSAVQDRLLLLGRKSAIERMASFLLAMAEHEPASRSRNGKELELSMSRADIADYLGLTVETVSRVFTQLRNRRIVALPSVNHVVFLDRDALEDIAGGETLEGDL